MTFPCAEEAFAGAIVPKGEMMLRRPGLILILGRQVGAALHGCAPKVRSGLLHQAQFPARRILAREQH